MHRSCILALISAIGAATSPLAADSVPPEPVQNANHIFNAIHSSMRQWGSALNHNGMSFFLAEMPQGIKLYHGDGHPEHITGVRWLAFDPEHAFAFARSGPKRPETPPKPSSGSQQVMGGDQDGPAGEDNGGWLHTYTTAKNLRLILIDGMSAGKSKIGTLDLQDRVLFEDEFNGGVLQENVRAEAVCRIAREEWNDRVDGVIRLASGFEVILCNSEQNLEPVHVARVRSSSPRKGDNEKKGGKPTEVLQVMRARYNGIGGERVVLNYDHFVTAYNHSLNLFPDDSTAPRLNHLPFAELKPIRKSLTSLVMAHDVGHRQVNWQAITDMIVQKYSHPLRELASRHHHHHGLFSLVAEVARIWNTFVDQDNRDVDEEMERCATQFIPANAADDSLAHRAVYAVSSRICASFVEVLETKEYDVAVDVLRSLMDYLSWTAWKECHGCHDDEFCQIPIWPQGSWDDFEHPRCQKFESAYQGPDDFWGPVWR